MLHNIVYVCAMHTADDYPYTKHIPKIVPYVLFSEQNRVTVLKVKRRKFIENLLRVVILLSFVVVFNVFHAD